MKCIIEHYCVESHKTALNRDINRVIAEGGERIAKFVHFEGLTEKKDHNNYYIVFNDLLYTPF